MLGCNYHCDFCQNWESSQVLRDEDAGVSIESVTPEQIIELAHRYHAKVLTSTYNEPLITSEWAVSIFEMGKAAGFKGSYVSNGHATPEILDALRPYVDFFKVDLKCFDAKHYRGLGGNLDTVLNTIRLLKEKGYWVEIVTLIIPEFNDSEDELHRMAQFIASVSVDIPWHVTAFHPDYHRDAAGYTLVNTLIRACEMGTAEGLRFCYAGNLPGEAGEWENTRCFSCKKTLVTRRGFRVQENLITGNQCPFCQTVIPGYWN
jgi:pyruvate formate lyase activating enzyme